jgi:hypothetical protein
LQTTTKKSNSLQSRLTPGSRSHMTADKGIIATRASKAFRVDY